MIKNQAKPTVDHLKQRKKTKRGCVVNETEIRLVKLNFLLINNI